MILAASRGLDLDWILSRDLETLNSILGSVQRNYYRDLIDRTLSTQVGSQARAKDAQAYIRALRKLAGDGGAVGGLKDFKRLLGNKGGI